MTIDTTAKAETSCTDSCCRCIPSLDGRSLQMSIITTTIAVLFTLIAFSTETGVIPFPALQIPAALVALTLTAIPIAKEAIVGLYHRERNVCELAALAVIGAVVIGEFTTAAEISVIISIGELVEEYVYNRSKKDIEGMITRHPRFSQVISDGEIREIAVETIREGDLVVVRPGDIVPVDGTINTGYSRIDESCLTGESLPVAKQQGDTVCSGSTNLEGTLIVTAIHTSRDSTYAKIVSLVQEARQRRPPTHPVIDLVARWYTPLMLVISGSVLLWSGSIIRAITVLIVACPCALLLATPSAILAAIGHAAKEGILIKGGEFLEACRSITTIVFDKTGTLTTGEMSVTAIEPSDPYTEEELLRIAGQAEASSSHPVAQALWRSARAKGISCMSKGTTREYMGEGVVDRDEDRIVHVGTREFLQRHGVKFPEKGEESRNTRAEMPVWVAINHSFAGIIRIADTIRPETRSIITRLRQMGYPRIVVLSGDNRHTAESVARECGIEEQNVHARLRPADKEEYLDMLQNAGDRVCFVGDGTNDGPALARATIGMSIAGRADTVALESAGVILMRGGLNALPLFLSLGIRTRRIIYENVTLALGLNLLLIISAAAGYISPAGGAIGHQAATLLVLLNSLRLVQAMPEIRPHSKPTSRNHADITGFAG